MLIKVISFIFHAVRLKNPSRQDQFTSLPELQKNNNHPLLKISYYYLFICVYIVSYNYSLDIYMFAI